MCAGVDDDAPVVIGLKRDEAVVVESAAAVVDDDDVALIAIWVWRT